MRADLIRESEWVLSGSLCGWGDFAIPLFALVVFLWIPSEIRMERLAQREVDRYGVDALSPGGWFHKNHLEFMAYASSYDSGGLEIRSRTLHEQWMAKLTCPVIKIEIPLSIPELVAIVEEKLDQISNAEGPPLL